MENVINNIFEVGMMHFEGRDVPQNYKAAFKHFIEAAEQGHAKAQFVLGYMYENGQGVPPNYKEAIKWWIKAAYQGSVSAQNNLGKIYYNGQGVKKDLQLAYIWTSIALANGDDEEMRKRLKSTTALLSPEQLEGAQASAKHIWDAHNERWDE